MKATGANTHQNRRITRQGRRAGGRVSSSVPTVMPDLPVDTSLPATVALVTSPDQYQSVRQPTVRASSRAH
jgi:hypothetical protein